MHTPDDTKALRDKMLEYLEAALAIADETKSGTVGYIIETALDQARSEAWPEFNTRLDTRK
jgi:hypothetical protein